MEYINGKPLGGQIGTTVPRNHLPKVAEQFANIFNELQKFQRPCIGRLAGGAAKAAESRVVRMDWHALSGPLATSLEFYYAETEETIRETLLAHAKEPAWVAACWMVRTALTQFILPQRIHGPFPLCHLDLHHENLLFDSDFNICGVIDWSNAQTVPIERLAFSMERMTAPGLSNDENEAICEFRKVVSESLQAKEAFEDDSKNIRQPYDEERLSSFIRSDRYDIAYRYTFSNPRQIFWIGQMIASIIFPDHAEWERLVAAYGTGKF